MFACRLAVPIDEFDDLTPLPGWLRDCSPESVAWQLRTALALADAAVQVGWRGDMRHLPSVGHTGASPAWWSSKTMTTPPSSLSGDS